LAKLCLCLTGKTIEQDLLVLDRYRKYADLVELRVDCLDPDEQLLVRRFPEQAGLPVILTIRRDIDGGRFTGGEGYRVNLLSRGLAFADSDRRHNFAYVDIEDDLKVPSLEEAARTFGTRIIRSCHNIQGVDQDVAGRLRSLSRAGDELVKLAVTPRGTEDLLRVIRGGKETAGMDKILVCMGDYGRALRILAGKTGSALSYASAGEEGFPLAAAGQFGIKELAELYRFREIGEKTKVYAVVGYPLKVTGSPKFFNTVFARENIDAVYVPFPADSMGSFMELAEEIGIAGMSVTVPYKEAVLPYLTRQPEELRAIGACNTALRYMPGEGGAAAGWHGVNTDAPGFSDSLLAFTGRKNFRGKKITILGAGGAARAVAAEVYRLGGRALILNRTARRARDLAFRYKFRWGGFDDQGAGLMEKFSDIIIQTTPAGTEGHGTRDPLEIYAFSGRETVMDLVYQPERSPFLERAAGAGCRVLNGYDMLIRQARYQYTHFTGKEFPVHLLSRVQF
jgi:3-dehydroquinate dehydratase/shikimate dehydrogenase